MRKSRGKKIICTSKIIRIDTEETTANQAAKKAKWTTLAENCECPD
jgi:hypothetical protein